MYSLIILASLLFGNALDMPDGTLLFVEGGNKIVRDVTESPYSHVAIIFNIDGKPHVYEAVRPVCRKIPLDEYVSANKDYKLLIRKPKDLKPENATKMKEYCELQMGRRYRVKSWMSEKPEKGIHCGELTTRTMIAGGMKINWNPCAAAPKDVMNFCESWYEKESVISEPKE